MRSPTVTELPSQLEAVTQDPFIDALGEGTGSASAAHAGDADARAPQGPACDRGGAHSRLSGPALLFAGQGGQRPGVAAGLPTWTLTC